MQTSTQKVAPAAHCVEELEEGPFSAFDRRGRALVFLQPPTNYQSIASVITYRNGASV